MRDFLEYLHKNKNQEERPHQFIRPAQRPLLLVLLGEFEEREIEILKEKLRAHMDIDRYVFWMGLRNCGYEGIQYEIPWEDISIRTLREREELQNGGTVKGWNSVLEGYAGDILNKIEGIHFGENNSIQIAVIVKTDQISSGLMYPLAKLLAESFSIWFFNNVYLELYMLTNQGGIMGGEEREFRWALNYLCLKEAEKLYMVDKITSIPKHIAHMVYFFSNIKSDGTLLKQNDAWVEQYSSIALLLSLKMMQAENVEYLYSDKEFGMGVKNASVLANMQNEGIINSAGYIHLEKNIYLIRLIVYHTVWTEITKLHDEGEEEELRRKLAIRKDDLQQLISVPGKIRRISPIDTKSIVCKQVNPDIIYQSRNGEALQKIFGNNLDLYLDLNMAVDAENSLLNEWQESFRYQLTQLDYDEAMTPFDIKRILEKVETELHNMEKQIFDITKDQEETLAEWKQKMAQPGGRVRGEELIYILADGYCTKSQRYRNAKLEMENCKWLLYNTQSILRDYRNFSDFTDTIIHQLETEISAVEKEKGVEAIQNFHTRDFYQDYTVECIRESKEFKELLKRLANYVGREEALMEDVVQVCENELLRDKVLTWSFLEELQNRLPGYRPEGEAQIQTSEDVYRQLLFSIGKNAHYLCKEIFGGANVYQQTCCFTSDNSLATIAKEMRIDDLSSDFCMFCDSNNDQFDVLYVVGNINLQRIQYVEKYKESYYRVSEAEGIACQRF